MGIKLIQLQKRASYTYQDIQDKAAWNNGNRTFALADGTTQSFNSEKWAQIITEKFVASPSFEPEQIINLFTDCALKFANEVFIFSPKPAVAVLEKAKKAKGASATFLGLQFLQNNTAKVISCGDTNLFMVNSKGNFIKYFPYYSIEELNANNHFLNTVQLIEQKIDGSYFQVTNLQFSKDKVYIMATDALSRLFLKNKKTIKEVMQIKNFDMLHRFCLKYWDKKELEEDDISAIIINQDGSDKVEQIIPPADFAFPKEQLPDFTPTPILPNNEIPIFTNMQMQEIYHQFSCVANDFREVKRNQKTLEFLVKAAIAISLLNFVCFVSFVAFDYYKGKKTHVTMNLQKSNTVELKPDSTISPHSYDFRPKKWIQKENAKKTE